MAIQRGVKPLSDNSIQIAEATETISTYRAVKRSSLDTTDGHMKVALTSAVTSIVHGFTLNNHESVASGEEVEVITSGWTYATANAAVAVGDELVADSTGKVGPAAPASGVNNFICGHAESAASSDGDIIQIEIVKYFKQGQ